MSINLPELHAFPFPLSEAKRKMNKARASGTHEVGLELQDLLIPQQSPSIIYCYKFSHWAMALFVENASDLVFQHYDDDTARVREARIYLLDKEFASGIGRIRAAWDKNQITLGIADEQYKVIDQVMAR